MVRLTLLLSLLIGAYWPIYAFSLPYSEYQLQGVSVNGSALSITAFAFKAGIKPPGWVDRLFGSKAVFWGNVKKNKDIHKARSNFEREKIMPAYGEWPECSITMLAFARLGTVAPFRGIADRFVRPAIGKGWLWPITGTAGSAVGNARTFKPWDCFYRALYNNGRQADHPDTFWMVVVYCPAPPGQTHCTSFKNMHFTRKQAHQYQHKHQHQQHQHQQHQQLPVFAQHRLVLELHNQVQWSNTISTYYSGDRHSRPSIQSNTSSTTHGGGVASAVASSSSSDISGSMSGGISVSDSSWHPTIAVCTAWTYTTNLPEKELPNQALIYEFLRYYANMGFKLLVYDRDGAAMRGLFDSSYVRANPQRSRYIHAIDRSLVYHNYTVHSMLMPELSNSTFDMEDPEYKSKSKLFVNDKELTYSHCRFQAQSLYGIQRVIVVDFDEFLYCKHAAATPHAQMKFIQQYLNELQHDGIDQVMFGKTTVAARVPDTPDTQSSVLDCVQNTLQSAATAATAAAGTRNNSPSNSIFNCFASIEFIDSIPITKSVHLNHNCPFTSMHHACGGCPMGSTFCAPDQMKHCFYDCLCDTVPLDTCDIVHLSVVQTKYGTETSKRFKYSEIQDKYSELWSIANAGGD